MSASSLVSIITPAYNAEQWLPRLIHSILSQSHQNLEWIIVDDASNDRTFEIAQQAAARDPRISAVRLERNSGVAEARNRGLRRARGDYVCFIDADDYWHNDKLSTQLQGMLELGARVSYMDYYRVSESGAPLGRVTPPESVGFDELLRSNRIGNLTAMARRDALQGFEFKQLGHEDYVFWLEVVRHVGTARRIASAEPLCFYTVRRGSLSASKLTAAGWQWKIYRRVFRLGLARSVQLFVAYFVLALEKRRRSR